MHGDRGLNILVIQIQRINLGTKKKIKINLVGPWLLFRMLIIKIIRSNHIIT